MVPFVLRGRARSHMPSPSGSHVPPPVGGSGRQPVRGRGVVPSLGPESRIAHPVADPSSAFLNHWTSGTVSWHGGQIAAWVPIASSAVGVHTELLDRTPPLLGFHQDNFVTHSRPTWLVLVSQAFKSLRLLARSAPAPPPPRLPLPRNMIIPAAWTVGNDLGG